MLLHTDRIGLRQRPRLGRGIETQRCKEHRSRAGRRPMRGNAGKRTGIDIGRLPAQMRQPLGEVDGALAAAARDFDKLKNCAGSTRWSSARIGAVVAGDVRVGKLRIEF